MINDEYTMSFSCSTCSYTTKHKCNLERHVETCKGGRSTLYSCDKCGYFTKNKPHFERHQSTELCKRKSQQELSLLQRFSKMEKKVDKMWEWFQNRPKTAEELKEEEEEIKEGLKRKLDKWNIPYDVYETLQGLRMLTQKHYDELVALQKNSNRL